MELRLETMTWKEAQKAIAEGVDTALLPVGSVEQHGYHGPLGTDTLIAGAVAGRVAEKIHALCLPPLWYGVSCHHMAFSGTVTLRPDLMIQIIEDISESLIRHDIKKILILNGHGGNTNAVKIACINVRNRHSEVFMAYSDVFLALHDVYHELPEALRQDSWRMMAAHSGLLESSVVMAVDETLVKTSRAVPLPVDRFVQMNDPAMSVSRKFHELTESGGYGDASKASAEAGRIFLDKTVEQIAKKYKKALDTFGH